MSQVDRLFVQPLLPRQGGGQNSQAGRGEQRTTMYVCTTSVAAATPFSSSGPEYWENVS